MQLLIFAACPMALAGVHGWRRDVFVLEHGGLGAAFRVGVSEPAEIVSVMVHRRRDVMSGSAICSPCFSFVGVVQHLDFNAQRG